MKMYKVKIEITGEQIDDILTTAFEGGITYWCDEVKVVRQPKEKYKYLSEVLTRGGRLKVHDEEGWHNLSLGGVLDALGKSNFNFEDYDVLDADVVVQRAVFGEVVYG